MPSKKKSRHPKQNSKVKPNIAITAGLGAAGAAIAAGVAGSGIARSDLGGKIAKGAKRAGKAIKDAAAKGINRLVGGPNGNPDKTRAVGAAIVASGISDLVNEKNKAGKIKGIIKTGLGGFAMLFNHDSWTQHFEENPDLINLNYGQNKSVPTSQDWDGSVSSTTPAVMRLVFQLTQGKTRINAWDTSISRLYRSVRRANAGAINATPYDYDHYVFALANLYAAYFHAKRIYGCLTKSDVYDTRVPAAYAAALGVDMDGFRNNIGDFRVKMNVWGKQLRAVAPLRISWFERLAWMCGNLFADSNDTKASVFCYVPNHLVYFNVSSGSWTPVTTMSTLSSTATGLSYANFIAAIDTMIVEFVNNMTFAVIAGDILKAFGAESQFPHDDWSENYTTPVVYDEEALTQLQNAKVPGKGITVNVGYSASSTAFSSTSVTLTRSTGSFTSSYQERLSMRGYFHDNILINSYKDSIRSIDTLKFTRFAVSALWNAANTAMEYTSFGTEIITECEGIMRRDTSTAFYHLTYTGMSGFCIIDTGTSNAISQQSATNLNRLLLAWSHCDYAPQTVVVFTNDPLLGSPTSYVVADIIDLNNYAVVNAQNLNDFHAYVVQNYLWVPELVKDQRTYTL